MKLAFLLTLLLLAAIAHDSEAIFRGLGRRIKEGARKFSDRAREAATRVAQRGRGLVDRGRDVLNRGRDALNRGMNRGREALRDTVGRNLPRIRNMTRTAIKKIFRGKRSALTLNRMDDVNAVDIAMTFNLDLPTVQEVFYACDLDKNGSLDGQEVLIFLQGVVSHTNELRERSNAAGTSRPGFKNHGGSSVIDVPVF